MTMYIKRSDSADEDWTELKSVRFVSIAETNPETMMDDSRLHSLTGPVTSEFTFQLSKWGYVDFLMLMLGMTRKEARKHTGRKPILHKGKAWR